jgi:hypothetical protein
MNKYNDPDVFIVLGGLVAILLLGALLGEVAVWIAKLFGFEFEDKEYINTDFVQRLQDGEELSADNMFANQNDRL